MRRYRYRKKNVRDYLFEVYESGLHRSGVLSEDDIEEIIRNIGIFRFKGYLYAFRREITLHSIDDVLTLYYFDKYLTRYVMELTASVETMLKTRAVELCYKWTDNPFFYLLRENHKYENFRINKPTLENWKSKKAKDGEKQDHYTHYCLYYKQTYRFDTNRQYYLQETCIELLGEVNYPPFHYMIESATLGALITFIKSIKIGKFDLLNGIAKEMGINPKIFKHYLERLNEVRNRAAHRERLFNRGYRSVRAFGAYHTLRKAIEPHCFADVYLYLYFMAGHIEQYSDFDDFFVKEIDVLFSEYRTDRLIELDSKGLNKKMDEENFAKIKMFILKGMGIKKASHSRVT